MGASTIEIRLGAGTATAALRFTQTKEIEK
jgi:hypothetical protein